MRIAIMIILLILGVFLTLAVLLQHGKSHGLGTITGAAENFLGKERGSRFDRMLSKLTTVLGILFVVLVLVVYIMQPTYQLSSKHQSIWQDLGISYYDADRQSAWINPDKETAEEENESDSSSDSASESETESQADSETEGASAAA